jgi:hypothetical protein
VIDVGEPLVASAIAVLALGERIGRLDIAMSAGSVLAGPIIASGIAVLDHSPGVRPPRQVR